MPAAGNPKHTLPLTTSPPKRTSEEDASTEYRKSVASSAAAGAARGADRDLGEAPPWRWHPAPTDDEYRDRGIRLVRAGMDTVTIGQPDDDR